MMLYLVGIRFLGFEKVSVGLLVGIWNLYQYVLEPDHEFKQLL